MDEDESSRRKEYPLSPSKMSKTPSWIMLGFVLGALAVIALLPRLQKKAPPNPESARRLEFTKPPAPRQPQPLSKIEGVFAEWGNYALWSDDDTTEVALWNDEYREFSDLYEVRRDGKTYYFRTLTRLTRRMFTPPNLPLDCPLRFTEPKERYTTGTDGGPPRREAELKRPPGVSAPVAPPRINTTPIAPSDPGIDLAPHVKK
jgi:hypothetical protein